MKAKTSPKNPAPWQQTILTGMLLPVSKLMLPVFLVPVFLLSATGHAQDCQNSADLDAATRSAISAAGQRAFDLAAKGDTASLRQNAIATLAADFSHTEVLVKDKQPDLASAQATVRPFFLLEVEGTAPLPDAEFYCGVFGKNGQTSGSAVFSLHNLAPGKYAVVLFDAISPKAHNSFSMILQQVGTDWKLADLYIEPAQIAGHDSEWFAARAREYKTKSQMHNAWLYYLQSRSLISPLPFMATLATDKLYEEFQTLQPADIPSNAKPVDLTVGAVTYKLTALFSAPVGNDLDLVVRYQIADASNTTQAYQTNLAVAKALIAKYPEVKDAFTAVVARAVDPSGRDFGTPLEMKDAK